MTIINHNLNKLCIEISTSAPDEQRDVILMSLSAAVRWNAGCPRSEKLDKIDEANLYVIASLIDSLIETKTIGK